MKQCKYKIHNPHTNETICSWYINNMVDAKGLDFAHFPVCEDTCSCPKKTKFSKKFLDAFGLKLKRGKK